MNALVVLLSWLGAAILGAACYDVYLRWKHGKRVKKMFNEIMRHAVPSQIEPEEFFNPFKEGPKA